MDDIVTGYGRTEVLHGVTVSVPPGSVVALFGANGAGKTTLMRTAAGFLRPTRGRVLLDGVDVTGSSVHERVRMGLCDIPEGRSVFPSLSVKENLVLASPRGSGNEALSLAIEAFPILGQRMSQMAGSLSGGEQQMLALSRAYMCKPKVVLLDEVSLGLSPVAVDQVYEFLRLLREGETTLVLIEQYVRRALDLADFVYVLEKGSCVVSSDSSTLPSEEILNAYLGYRDQEGLAADTMAAEDI